jgi:hypothetical protein
MDVKREKQKRDRVYTVSFRAKRGTLCTGHEARAANENCRRRRFNTSRLSAPVRVTANQSALCSRSAMTGGAARTAYRALSLNKSGTRISADFRSPARRSVKTGKAKA